MTSEKMPTENEKNNSPSLKSRREVLKSIGSGVVGGVAALGLDRFFDSQKSESTPPLEPLEPLESEAPNIETNDDRIHYDRLSVAIEYFNHIDTNLYKNEEEIRALSHEQKKQFLSAIHTHFNEELFRKLRFIRTTSFNDDSEEVNTQNIIALSQEVEKFILFFTSFLQAIIDTPVYDPEGEKIRESVKAIEILDADLIFIKNKITKKESYPT